jgi:hypothetical protein
MEVTLKKKRTSNTHYTFTIDGVKFSPFDIFECLDAIKSHDSIVITDPRMVKLLTDHAGLKDKGSMRWMTGPTADMDKLAEFEKALRDKIAEHPKWHLWVN